MKSSPNYGQNFFRAPHALAAVLWAGTLAGCLDILGALFYYVLSTGKDPGNVLRYIASGVLGRAAFAREAWIGALGLALHFVAAYSFALCYFWVYPLFARWLSGGVRRGTVYGILVWGIMNMVVVPLSKTPPLPFSLKEAAMGLFMVVVLVGIPISVVADRYYRDRQQKARVIVFDPEKMH